MKKKKNKYSSIKKVQQLQTIEMKLLAEVISRIPSLYSSGCGLGPRQLTDGLEARIQLKTFL